MFAGINIKDDYLSDEDKNSSFTSLIEKTIGDDEGTNVPQLESLTTVESPQDSKNVVVINNSISAQEDDDSFILITKTNKTEEIENTTTTTTTTASAEMQTMQESIISEDSIEEPSDAVTDSVTSNVQEEEIEFHNLEQSEQHSLTNEDSFENMERSFMKHETSVTSPREPLSILTSEEIDTDDSSASSSSSSPVLLIGDQMETPEPQIFETVEETKQVLDESSASTNSIEETSLGSMFSKEELTHVSEKTNCIIINEDGLTNFLANIDPRNPRFNFLLHTGVIACLSLFVIGFVELIICK